MEAATGATVPLAGAITGSTVVVRPWAAGPMRSAEGADSIASVVAVTGSTVRVAASSAGPGFCRTVSATASAALGAGVRGAAAIETPGLPAGVSTAGARRSRANAFGASSRSPASVTSVTVCRVCSATAGIGASLRVCGADGALVARGGAAASEVSTDG